MGTECQGCENAPNIQVLKGGTDFLDERSELRGRKCMTWKGALKGQPGRRARAGRGTQDRTPSCAEGAGLGGGRMTTGFNAVDGAAGGGEPR